MKLYLKVLNFLKPFWKMILASILLTFVYVIFNNISMWVSVDFIRELFTPQQIEGVQSDDTQQTGATDIISDQLNQLKGNSLYQKANTAMKQLIIQSDRYQTLKMVCIVIFVSFLLKNIAFYFRRVLITYIELKVTVDIRDRLQSVLLRLPIRYFESHHSGELASIVFNDVKAVNDVLNNSFGKMLLSPVQVLTNLVILLAINWKLTLITLLVLPISGYLIVVIGKSIRRKSRRVFEQISQVMATFQEEISAIRIVKAFTTEDREEALFKEENRKYFHFNFRSNKLSFVTSPMNETIGIFILIVLLWYGGRQVYAQTGMAAEDFIRFLVFLFTMFQPLKDLSDINNVIQRGMAAAERIFNVIDTETEEYNKPGTKPLTSFDSLIQYQNVHFHYNKEDGQVLKNINLRIRKGETIAFVGHSGSGKTTIVNLLPRFYDVQEGKILIDGIDIGDYQLQSLRQQMGIVTQDTLLFNTTIRNNIAYGMDAVTEQDIIDAAKAANAWEFIEKIDLGLDSQIGEKGVKLSGGQKQRLSIARAILKNPPILILDEATSALDTESERLVQDAIENLMQNRTVLVVAHRLSTIIHSNSIVVLEDGKMVGCGSHKELLETCPVYQHLYRMQFRE